MKNAILFIVVTAIAGASGYALQHYLATENTVNTTPLMTDSPNPVIGQTRPEFAMMEIQWAYKDYDDTMKITEELWEYVAKKLTGSTKFKFGKNTIDVKAPWKRLRVVSWFPATNSLPANRRLVISQ